MDAPHRRTPGPPEAATRTRAQQLGDAGEQAALAFLVARGLRPLARNVRFKGGELDLVMLDGETLVFVEVRRRGRSDFGDALDSVDARKARKLVLAARLYLQREPRHARRDCRFDVVGFDDGEEARWVRGAFSLDDL
ncbi:YraN family protein [Silanimonas sp.]|jgi:putative endonuclease|uniref:YraN family protein n=1 Tax=Silanimonas sp. TaxID=1929290 RepID=UPI0037CB1F58